MFYQYSIVLTLSKSEEPASPGGADVFQKLILKIYRNGNGLQMN